MKNIAIVPVIVVSSIFFEKSYAQTQVPLAKTILADQRLDSIQTRALRLLTGFAAGTSYGEVWIRDFNTFIKGSLAVQSKEKVKDMLLLFFKMQGNTGDIVDGVIDSTKANVGYEYRYSPLAAGWAAHKNTV